MGSGEIAALYLFAEIGGLRVVESLLFVNMCTMVYTDSTCRRCLRSIGSSEVVLGYGFSFFFARGAERVWRFCNFCIFVAKTYSFSKEVV